MIAVINSVLPFGMDLSLREDKWSKAVSSVLTERVLRVRSRC